MHGEKEKKPINQIQTISDMKKFLSRLLTIFGLVLAAQVVMLTSCEGPEGPEGPQGPVGEDGSAICGDCHDMTTDLYAKVIQYEASIHRTGGNYERSTVGCAHCHTHEGFLEQLETGAVAEDIFNPTPINCRTCHPIHETYTQADYALRGTEAFELAFMDDGVTYDMGNANVCSRCHQPRTPDPMPEVGGADVTIGSPYWGYHHGPQAAIMVGEGGVRLPGSIDYNSVANKHYESVDDGCVDCHMAKAFGSQAGGHTFNVTYFYHGSTTPNMAACTDCHSGATNFDILGGQTEIHGLLDSLYTLLVAEGVIADGDHRITPGTYTAEQAAAFLNWQIMEEDRSLGVHNLGYTRAILVNTIETMNAK